MNNNKVFLAIAMSLSFATVQAELPDGYWGLDQTQPIMDTTQRVRLAPDLSHLTSAERLALDELLAAGHIMNALYEGQKHRGAAAAKASLVELHEASGGAAETSNLLDIYYLSKGPIATTLDNVRGPIVPTDAEQPGKNVYPFGTTKAEIDAFIAANPAREAEIKDVRAIVRRASADNLSADIAKLEALALVSEDFGAPLFAAESDLDSAALDDLLATRSWPTRRRPSSARST